MAATDPTDHYETRYVGFVDILGFENLVREADKNPQRRQVIIEALQTVRRQKAPQQSPTDLRVQIFSDSVIVSAKNTADGLWHLLLSLDALAWNLLLRGILVRGGVALGGAQHDEQIVFGVGIVDAYRLESTVAKYPRIVLARSVAEECMRLKNTDPIFKGYYEKLKRDVDGVMFIHYLHELARVNRQPSKPFTAEETLIILSGKDMMKLIQQVLDTTLDAPAIYEKYRWLADYWNDSGAVDPTRFPPPRIGKLRLAGEE